MGLAWNIDKKDTCDFKGSLSYFRWIYAPTTINWYCIPLIKLPGCAVYLTMFSRSNSFIRPVLDWSTASCLDTWTFRAFQHATSETVSTSYPKSGYCFSANLFVIVLFCKFHFYRWISWIDWLPKADKFGLKGDHLQAQIIQVPSNLIQCLKVALWRMIHNIANKSLFVAIIRFN